MDDSPVNKETIHDPKQYIIYFRSGRSITIDSDTYKNIFHTIRERQQWFITKNGFSISIIAIDYFEAVSNSPDKKS